MIQFLLCFACLAPAPSVQSPETTECCVVDRPWVLQLQQEDGSWDADRMPEDAEGAVSGRPEDDVAVTSLLVLSLLGEGQTSNVGQDQDRLARAMSWLISQQTETGRVGRTEHGRVLHYHTLAALVLSESVFFKGEPDHSESAKKAVKHLREAALEGGGWSASGKAEDPVDPVTTAWAVMVLRSASDAKLGESMELIEQSASWFRHRCDAESGLFSAGDDADPDYKATLCALTTRFFAGEKPGASPNFGLALNAAIEARPEFLEDPEYYYLTSLLAYQAAGKRWKGWRSLLKNKVLEVYDDHYHGSIPVEPQAPVCGSIGAFAFGLLNIGYYFRSQRLVGGVGRYRYGAR